jgi:pathogenesis-related protein 1
MYKKVSVTITTTLVIAAILTVSWSALQRSHAQTNGNFENTILQIHNSERAAVNVPPIAWSASLAADAQSYAQHLTTLGLGPSDILPHATGTGQGENLSWGTAGFYSPADGVRQWAAEKHNYNGGPITQAHFAKGAPMIGHYTQMVWKNTSEVGCGTASSNTLEVLVCRYSPPGNYLGQTPY